MRSVDPNSIQGPSGYGPDGFVQPRLFSYGIEFENKPTATAPAQVVVVTQQLNSNLDWSTFQLGSIAFGDTVIEVPAGQTSFSTRVDLTATLGIDVDVSADFNSLTGLATWTFTSIDPATQDVPANPLAGFLPPDQNGEGMGFVDYSILPKASAPTGTQIPAQATVVFDVNAPLSTAAILNTVDVGPVTSRVSPLPAKSPATFTVNWSGTDAPGGSGIATYSVYVSDNGGAIKPFVTNTTATSASFTGQVGHTYSFYSVATDNVGNVQPTPTAAQATTQLLALPTSTVNPLPATTNATSFTLSWSGSPGSGASSIASFEIFVSDDSGSFTPFQKDTTATSATFTGQAGHLYGFYSIATDNLGNVQTTPTSAQATTQIVVATTQPAFLQFSSAQFAANVTDGSHQILVSRAGNLTATVSVVVSSPGGPDVAAFQQTISFGPNTLSAAVNVPILNNGQPGMSDVVIPLSLSTPGAGAKLGATVSANLVVHDNNPFPSPVTVNSVRLATEKIKVGKGKKAKTKVETVLQLQFSGALSGASNLGAYQLLSGKTKKRVTTYNKRVPLASAVYSASATSWTVMLVPTNKLNLSQPEQLRITAADLTDAFGRPLDGDDNGQPGGDFVAILSKKGVTVASAADRVTTSAVDLVLREESLVANALLLKRRIPEHH